LVESKNNVVATKLYLIFSLVVTNVPLELTMWNLVWW